MPSPTNPLIVQSDKTILLEVNHEQYVLARDALARFAELEKSPEYIHTYRITPLSLWNAASSGLHAGHILGALDTFSKYPLPANVSRDIEDTISRFGRVKLIREGEALILVSDDPVLITEIVRHKKGLRHRGIPALPSAPHDRGRRAVWVAAVSTRGGGSVPRGGIGARRERDDCPPVRGG